MDKNDFLNDLPQAKPSYTPAPDGQAPGKGLVIESGTLLAERYEVKERIGAGGMGAVFKAFDRNRDKDIAIKVLLPDLFSNEAAKERFTQEAQISSELSHPNIVNVFDIVVTGDLTFLTMELLEGQNLREYMDAQHRGMDQEEAIGIIQDVVKALEYAHQSMVHRDIKPENIFICDDGSIKLMDFGIAQAQSFSRASKVGMSLGTAYYMAPEQLKAKGKVDARADQYALAVLCYELLIGELPTGAVKKPHELKKDIPKKLSNVIMKGMEPSADERFTDVASFGKALAGKGRVSGGLSTKWLMGAGITVITFSAFFFGSGNSIDLDFSSSNTANTSSGSDETSFIDSIKETFFPDPAIEQEAIALSAELETLGKAIERSEKQLKEKKQETKAEVNRIESYLRTAKGEEKESLTSSLNQANVEAEASNNAYELFADLSTSSDQFIEGQKQKSTADALLKAGKFKQAIQEYNSAKIAFTKISSVSDDIHDYALNKAKLNAFKNDVISFNTSNNKPIKNIKDFIENVMSAMRNADSDAAKLRFEQASKKLLVFELLQQTFPDIKEQYVLKNVESLVQIYSECDLASESGDESFDECSVADDLAFAIAKEKNSISAYGQYAQSNGAHTDQADELSGKRMDSLKTYDALTVYKEWFPQGMFINWVDEQFEKRDKEIEKSKRAEQARKDKEKAELEAKNAQTSASLNRLANQLSGVYRFEKRIYGNRQNDGTTRGYYREAGEIKRRSNCGFELYRSRVFVISPKTINVEGNKITFKIISQYFSKKWLYKAWDSSYAEYQQCYFDESLNTKYAWRKKDFEGEFTLTNDSLKYGFIDLSSVRFIIKTNDYSHSNYRFSSSDDRVGQSYKYYDLNLRNGVIHYDIEKHQKQ
ncbi:serine/threonine protein kinase [Thalassotalea hakodatensis]|uniref:serine/threonine protein kinase n=1 Tax=Thalassotalea hakodatensis TaxID=3030492 RepID=UPI002572B141|nr:serine/threonine-protein kinase [Thalassotalea hakodatensis]